jgi:hypothetical protein
MGYKLVAFVPGGDAMGWRSLDAGDGQIGGVFDGEFEGDFAFSVMSTRPSGRKAKA